MFGKVMKFLLRLSNLQMYVCTYIYIYIYIYIYQISSLQQPQLRLEICSFIKLFILNKSPTRCNSLQSDLFHCKVTLHVSDVTAPIIRSIENCNRSLRYSYFPPTWPDLATLEGSSCTGGCVTVFSTPDDGCYDTRKM